MQPTENRSAKPKLAATLIASQGAKIRQPAPAVKSPCSSRINAQNPKRTISAAEISGQTHFVAQLKKLPAASRGLTCNDRAGNPVSTKTSNGNSIRRATTLSVTGAPVSRAKWIVSNTQNVVQRMTWKWDAFHGTWDMIGEQNRSALPPKPPPYKGTKHGEIYDDEADTRGARRAKRDQIKALEDKERREEHKKDEEAREKVRKANLDELEKRYRGSNYNTTDVIEISVTDSTGRKSNKVRSARVSKGLLRQYYEYARTCNLEGNYYYHIYQGPGTVPQHFVVRRGHEGDFVTYALRENAGIFRQDTGIGPAYADVAATADKIVEEQEKHFAEARQRLSSAYERMTKPNKRIPVRRTPGPISHRLLARHRARLRVSTARAKLTAIHKKFKLRNIHSKSQVVRKNIRRRVAKDVNRLASGKIPRLVYEEKHFLGKTGLASFAALIRSDKSRAPKATRDIESVLTDSTHSFSTKFGGSDPIYLGTGKSKGGVTRGPEALRRMEVGADEGADMSDHSDDEEKEKEEEN